MTSSAFCRYFPGVTVRVVITGINGFVGSHLGRELRSQGHYVVGADWIRHTDHSIPLEESCDEFYLCDLRRPESWHTLLSWPLDAGERVHVFHCAADERGDDGRCVLNTVVADMHMLEAARRARVDRVAYVSRARPPLHMRLTEQLCGRYAREHGMDIRVTRLGDVYGPQGQWKDGREHVAAAVCRKVAAGHQSDALHMDVGMADVFSLLYIDDAIEAILRVMMHASSPGRPVVAMGTRAAMADVADLVMGIAGKRMTLVCELPDRHRRHHRLEPSAPDVAELLAEPPAELPAEPSGRAIGWEPTMSLHRGLAITYSWISDMVSSTHPDTHVLLRQTHAAPRAHQQQPPTTTDTAFDPGASVRALRLATG